MLGPPSGSTPDGEAPSTSDPAKVLAPAEDAEERPVQPEAGTTGAAEVVASPEASPGEREAEAAAERISNMDRRRRALLDLIAGTLDPSVDARGLLAIDLTREQDLATQDLTWILERAEALRKAAATPVEPSPDATARPRKSRRSASPTDVTVPPAPESPPVPADSPTLEAARLALREAYAQVVALPPERRHVLIAQHLAARQTREVQLQALRSAIAELQSQGAQLERFFAGDLPREIDVGPLLEVDLSTLSLSSPAMQDPELASLDAERRAQGVKVNGFRYRFLTMPAAQRSALLEAHAKVPEVVELPKPPPVPDPIVLAESVAAAAEDEAAALAAAREAALRQAEQAKTAARRAMEEERARLLGVQENLTRFGAELARRRADSEKIHDAAIGLNREVSEVLAEADASRADRARADALYGTVREQLRTQRELLDELLRRVISGATVPSLGTPPPGYDRADALVALRDDLEAMAGKLRAEENDTVWALAAVRRNDVVMLNHARLRLLEVTSSELRRKVTGLGPEGVDQVVRELKQIGLEVRYHLLALPRHLGVLRTDLRRAPVPAILAALEVLLAIVVFRAWRRRAKPLLDAAISRWRARAAKSYVAHRVADLLWYISRVRKPLEWLALVGMFFLLAPELDVLPEIQLVWLILSWTLIGSATILFVDAVAAKATRRGEEGSRTAALRIRSLRLIGLAIIYTGLVLSLANAVVGKGAIYAWVLKTCWLLLFPISILLVRWWRPHVQEWLASEPATPFVDWARHPSENGLRLPFLHVLCGGVFLLGRGIFREVLRGAATFEATRHVLAYLFRRGVARQAEVESHDRKTPIAHDLRAKLMQSRGGVLESVGADLGALQQRIAGGGASVSVVVGERGSGKSMVLARLREGVGESRSIGVTCSVEGVDSLRASLCGAIGLSPDADSEAMFTALRSLGRALVTVDDVQRLAQPRIGGLRGLDVLANWIGATGGEVAWVVAVDAAAWRYVSRARAGRLGFGPPVILRPWQEESIARLLRERTQAAGIEVSFDGLIIPRQYDAGYASERERTEAGYYRILWDYAGGNPEVALHFWCESLFEGSSSTTRVRLFVEPPAAELDALPLATHFVLRAVLQLELASKQELGQVVRLRPAEVDDIVRFALARGYLCACEDGRVSISLHWFRAVTRMLVRQHLVGRES